MLEAFDVLSGGKINEFFDLSRELGEPVAGQAELVRQAYIALRRLIKIAPHVSIGLGSAVSIKIKNFAKSTHSTRVREEGWG